MTSVCFSCGSRGISNEHWYLNFDIGDKNKLISILYNSRMKSIIYGTYYRPIAVKNRHRDYKLKNKTIRHRYEPRVGRCSKCTNNICDGSCSQTQIHRWIYDNNHTPDRTEELCASCHPKVTNSARSAMPKDPVTGKFIGT
jgi:hypothetical protein